MDNSIVKYDEEFDLTGMNDQEFLDKISRWLDHANSLAESATAYPVFAGRKIIGRLLELARKPPSEAIYVQVTDWNGLYIDGQLVAEGESFNLPDELDNLTVKFSVRPYNEADENYVLNVGGFPETWDELLDHQYMWEEDNR